MMNRRQFVGAMAAVTAVLGTGLGTLVHRRRVAVQGVDDKVAAILEGRPVILRAPEGVVRRGEVTDVHALRTKAGRGAPATEQVSLRVKVEGRGPSAGNYRLESEDLVLSDLYFSPVGPAGSERRLEAVITRIV